VATHMSRDEYKQAALDNAEELIAMKPSDHIVKAALRLGTFNALQEGFGSDFEVDSGHLACLSETQTHAQLATAKLVNQQG
jgi:hypothetical protein